MVNAFKFSTLPELYFGSGVIKKLPDLIVQFGTEVLLVTGNKSFYSWLGAEKLLDNFRREGLNHYHVKISGEPSPKIIDDIVNEYRNSGIQVVVSIGGGSVIDGGKAISAMLKHRGSVRDYLEGVGSKKPYGSKLPFIAAPTTAGTGSEATKNAVISEIGPKGFKKSLRHDRFIPDIALVDPELMISCPPELTGACGMDAFTQLLESYLSTAASQLTDSMAFDAIQLLYENLELAYEDGENIKARSAIAYAAFISGITLANAGLGVVHGFAQPLGSFFEISHGVVCGTLMAATNEITIQKLKNDNEITRNKYIRLGKLMANSYSKSDDYYLSYFIDELYRLTDKFEIEKLSAFGITEQDFNRIVSSTGIKNHPIGLDKEDLRNILLKRV